MTLELDTRAAINLCEHTLPPSRGSVASLWVVHPCYWRIDGSLPEKQQIACENLERRIKEFLDSFRGDKVQKILVDSEYLYSHFTQKHFPEGFDRVFKGSGAYRAEFALGDWPRESDSLTPYHFICGSFGARCVKGILDAVRDGHCEHFGKPQFLPKRLDTFFRVRMISDLVEYRSELERTFDMWRIGSIRSEGILARHSN